MPIQNLSISEIEIKYNLKFNCLVADCEGFMEIFLNENIDYIKNFKKILHERDQPQMCNYTNVHNILINNGFICIKDEFEAVYVKDPKFTINSIEFINEKLNLLDNICFIDESGNVFDNKEAEREEQLDILRYIKEDDIILELGARYGTVSCAIGLVLNNKYNHVAVEPENSVINALTSNRDNSNSKFHIFEGIVSKNNYNIINGGYGTRIKIKTEIDKKFDCIENLKLINKNNILLNFNYIFEKMKVSSLYFNDFSNIVELGAGEGIYSCTISSFLNNNNLFCIEKDNSFIQTIYNNKNSNSLNFNILENAYDEFNNINIKYNNNINSIIINRINYNDILKNNFLYIISNVKIILINNDVLDNYVDFIKNIKNNNFICINMNYYNVFIKDNNNIIDYNNSDCNFGNISINNLTGFIPEDYNVYINKDIEFNNYNTIFAHANCNIKINVQDSIKINAFVNNNIRNIFNTLNISIKFLVDSNLIDILNSENNITREYILEKGIYNIKLLVENTNSYCHTGFYWKYI